MSVEQARLARGLRGLVILCALIGLAVSIVGFLPGEAGYADAHRCSEQTIGFSTEFREHVPCTPSYTTLIEQRSAGGAGLLALVVIVLAPAVSVWRNPSRRHAWRWFIWTPLGTVVTLAIVFVATLSFDGEVQHVQPLWPLEVVKVGVSVLGALLLLVLPMMLLLAGKPKPLPEARVV